MSYPDKDNLDAEPLDAKTEAEWIRLAREVRAAAIESRSSLLNQNLEAAAGREPQAPVAPAYRLWAADNLARDRRFSEAVKAYDQAIESAQSSSRLIAGIDSTIGMVRHKAGAAALAGDVKVAIQTYEDLAKLQPESAAAFFQAGLLAERQRDYDRAADLYRRRANSKPSNRTDDAGELARRGLLRLQDSQTLYAADAQQLADWITTAIESRDQNRLEELISRTHFSIGLIGGHTSFEDIDLLEDFYRDMWSGKITSRRSLVGSGRKLYLMTDGWNGKWFKDSVVFLLTKAPQGWQWTGLGLTYPTELWIERWRPAVLMTNAPLPIEILAPWPEGQSFSAGDLKKYLVQEGTVLASHIFAGAVAFNYSRSPCGFGFRGFYYNLFTHTGQNAFAIDFTQYKQYVPYWPKSGGTRVLAARDGVVSDVIASTITGDSSEANKVEIIHKDPATNTDRFMTRYLHMEGPYMIPVSKMMPVYLGNRLGRIDDTGNSLIDHLHFSIHDKDLGWNSVRPSPLNGVRLEDWDGGTCVLSSNTERIGGGTVIEVTEFAGQNWLITPVARAANQPQPTVENQKWVLVLSGVAIIDLKGISSAQWLHETVSIRPNLIGPLDQAINEGGIPRPPGVQGLQYLTGFQVDQWAPFAGISSIFNAGESNNSGFAVEVWRPNPFVTHTDFSNTPVSNIFDGVQVDVSVRDSDAWLYSVSYNITLRGKIVFWPIVIT
jgi:Peptidase family M23